MAKDKILNDDIQARSITLIADDWENLGTMSLSEWKQMAQEKWLDLMQMSQRWDQAIVKMLDYGKFLYREKKQKNKQKSKSADLKTIKITFKISEHDLEVKQKQARKFAENNHPLKVSLQLRWRENHYAGLAFEKMNHFVSMIEEFYKIDKPVAKAWNNFTAMFKVIK